MEIRGNTIRGAQNYDGCTAGRRSGCAARRSRRRSSTRTSSTARTARAGKAPSGSTATPRRSCNRGKLEIRGNQLCTDTASELAVGDFNGDGHADVFQSVGTLWVYSPSGSREWQVLNDSTVRLAKLGLGDFNGDGKTDVFTQDGGHWLVSSGGTGRAHRAAGGLDHPDRDVPLRRLRRRPPDGRLPGERDAVLHLERRRHAVAAARDLAAHDQGPPLRRLQRRRQDRRLQPREQPVVGVRRGRRATGDGSTRSSRRASEVSSSRTSTATAVRTSPVRAAAGGRCRGAARRPGRCSSTGAARILTTACCSATSPATVTTTSCSTVPPGRRTFRRAGPRATS